MSSIQVLDRAASLLDALAQYEHPVSLKILSADSQLHPSTAFRILGALIDNGFVERNAASAYFLGRKLAKLATHVKHGLDIRTEARDIMDKLRDEIGETVNLTIREGDEIIYIERSTAKRMMRVEQIVGSRAPLHVTAIGKLMLAELGLGFIAAYASRTGLPAYTKHTLTQPEALQQHAFEAQAKGFALDNEEAELGVGCIGVLLRDGQGNVVGGLSISAPIERRKEEWIPLVRQAATAISARLA